jgi:hypothetical protein
MDEGRWPLMLATMAHIDMQRYLSVTVSNDLFKLKQKHTTEKANLRRLLISYLTYDDSNLPS